MRGELELAADVTLVVVGGLMGAIVARSLRLPLLLGYIGAGAALGRSGFGLARNSQVISAMAELGVVLLMFTIGVEMSLRRLWQARGAAFVAAPLQMALTAVLGFGLGRWIGWGIAEAVVLGFVLALSSTMVVVKLLSERGELHTRQGETMASMLLMQDLAAVLMVAVLPALAGKVNSGGYGVVSVAAEGLAFLLWVVVLARWIVPATMDVVARSYSKEVFVVTVAALCLTGAATGYWLGFSLALGAFAAGLVVSESHYSHEVLADVAPLRDLFGMVFFVSLGMLTDVRGAWEHWPWALAVLGCLLVGKPAISAVSVLAARQPARIAVVTGLWLAQIGEFSFLVAALARTEGILNDEAHGLLVAMAGVSLVLAPGLMKIGGWLGTRLAGLGSAREAERGRIARAGPSPAEGHVILCGFGRVGHLVGQALIEDGYPVVVVDHDHLVVSELRSRGIQVLYGDASSPVLIAAAGAKAARLAVVALPEGITTRLAVRALRRMNPWLPIVARVHRKEEVSGVRAEGAAELVYAEFEAGVEMMRYTLLLLGRDALEVDREVERVRKTGLARLVEGEE